METTESNDITLEELAGQAMKRLSQFFKSRDHTNDDRADIKVATNVLSSWTRHEQSKSAERAVNFQIARTLVNDPAQLAAYVAESEPKSGIVKYLPQTALTPLQEENRRQAEKLKAVEAENTQLIQDKAALLQEVGKGEK